MKIRSGILTFICCFALASCSGENDQVFPMPNQQQNPQPETPVTYKYLALGDSYTIGQSVCETCCFPAQLKTALEANEDVTVNLDLIAQTGWTTTNLQNAINTQNPTADYDLVTLLIGVNNQYQRRPFSLYEQQFPELVDKAIALAKGDKSNVIVVSIPDYRYTPYGNGLLNPETVSQEIDQYNAFAQNYCAQNNLTFVNITDITRLGLDQPELVANDGLHPSAVAYSRFEARLLPLALAVIND